MRERGSENAFDMNPFQTDTNSVSTLSAPLARAAFDLNKMLGRVCVSTVTDFVSIKIAHTVINLVLLSFSSIQMSVMQPHTHTHMHTVQSVCGIRSCPVEIDFPQNGSNDDLSTCFAAV